LRDRENTHTRTFYKIDLQTGNLAGSKQRWSKCGGGGYHDGNQQQVQNILHGLPHSEQLSSSGILLDVPLTSTKRGFEWWVRKDIRGVRQRAIFCDAFSSLTRVPLHTIVLQNLAPDLSGFFPSQILWRIARLHFVL